MASCISPFKLKDTDTFVPCGKCPPCRKRRASAWAFRLMEQEKVSESAHFITLTYDTKHVPITKNAFMGLDKKHVQDFFKRLRMAHELPRSGGLRFLGQVFRDSYNPSPIRYYAVGEYGGRTKRPHYHAIVFNCNIELIQKAWDKGQCHYGQVTGASVGYTLKYMEKPSRIPEHRNDDRQPEFSLMSKNLASTILLLTWLDGINPHWKKGNTLLPTVTKKSRFRDTIAIRYILPKRLDTSKVITSGNENNLMQKTSG